MPLRISCPSFVRPHQKTIRQQHLPSPVCSSTCWPYGWNHLCAWTAVRSTAPKASFSTTSPKPAESTYGMMSMPPDQRAESRRKEQLETDARAQERNYTRDWRAGDVYAPHDLSAAEARKWKKRQSPDRDAFDALSMNPLDCYKVSCTIYTLEPC